MYPDKSPRRGDDFLTNDFVTYGPSVAPLVGAALLGQIPVPSRPPSRNFSVASLMTMPVPSVVPPTNVRAPRLSEMRTVVPSVRRPVPVKVIVPVPLVRNPDTVRRPARLTLPDPVSRAPLSAVPVSKTTLDDKPTAILGDKHLDQ